MPASQTQLPNDAVEGGSRALGATDLLLLSRRVPKKFEGSALRAMRQQAPKGEPHLNPIDPRLVRSRHGCAQDLDGQRDDRSLRTSSVLSEDLTRIGVGAFPLRLREAKAITGHDQRDAQ